MVRRGRVIYRGGDYVLGSDNYSRQLRVRFLMGYKQVKIHKGDNGSGVTSGHRERT